jgi:hypothetical protein
LSGVRAAAAATVAAIALTASAHASTPFALRSQTFAANARMPMETVCSPMGGGNRSPELSWSGAPRGTESFALAVHDPDAPRPGGFDHWVAYNIPAGTNRLPEGAALRPDQLGVTTAGKPGYMGPCPPPGKVHHYHFTLYALDLPKIAPPNLDRTQLLERIDKHVLATAALTGLYGR